MRFSLVGDPQPVTSFDGTSIAVRAAGRAGAVPFLVANSVGANFSVWERTLSPFVGERRVVTWDHRGLFDSGPPVSRRLDPGAHAEDAIGALDHLGIDRVLVVSWSTGTRIAIEIIARYPERVAGAALICGGYGFPAARLLRFAELMSVLPLGAGVAKHFAPNLGALFRRAVARPELTGMIQQSGMVGATADIPALVAMLRGMAQCDAGMLLANYEAIVGDSARPLLGSLERPFLLVAGERDRFTPLRMMQEMEVEIPDARLEVFERATHYLPIEFPARLTTTLSHFSREIEEK